jgi:hypothetical protein
MGTYFKEYLSDIKLIDSIILDGNGNQISLTSDQRNAVNSASGGPINTENPLTSKSYVDTSISTAIGNFQAGASWKEPVDTVAATAPETPTVGDRYLNTTDDKIYGCEEAGVWNAGVAPTANWVVSTKDTDKVYMYDADGGTWNEQPNLNSIPDATAAQKGKVQIGTNIGVAAGVISVADASTTVKGVVQLATDGETSSGKAVQGNDARLLKGRYSNSYVGVTNFEVSHNLGSSKLIVQVWKGGALTEATVTLKTGSETTVVQIGLNSSSNVDVMVIALP